MRCRIAGLQVELCCSGRTARQSLAYLASDWAGPPDLELSVDPQKVLACCPELATEDMAEYMATGERFAVELLRRQGLMLHASALECQGQGICFSAPPGVGKSTLAQRWQRMYGANILNDDKPALRCVEGNWRLYGTPWSGKWDRSSNCCAPLEGICFLFRGETNAIEPLSPAQALPLLLSQTVYCLERTDLDRLLELSDRLLREVPIWRLRCRNDDSAARFSHSALFPDMM